MGKYAYFGEEDVQSYLALRSVRNHAAKRLLHLIRYDVLRRVKKHRDDEQRYEQEQG